MLSEDLKCKLALLANTTLGIRSCQYVCDLRLAVESEGVIVVGLHVYQRALLSSVYCFPCAPSTWSFEPTTSAVFVIVMVVTKTIVAVLDKLTAHVFDIKRIAGMNVLDVHVALTGPTIAI